MYLVVIWALENVVKYIKRVRIYVTGLENFEYGRGDPLR
jgi:hypothetical protein